MTESRIGGKAEARNMRLLVQHELSIYGYGGEGMALQEV